MKENTFKMIRKFKIKYPELDYLEENIKNTIDVIVSKYKLGGKILVCGNGGSSSDSEHIVGELMKEFYISRPIKNEKTKNSFNELYGKSDADFIVNSLQEGIPAISLVSQTGLITAFANDVNFDMAYAQQVYVYGNKNDVLIALSTSGNAKNVNYAAKVSQVKNMFVVSFTGKDGGKLKGNSDIVLNVPENETYKVQEYHLPLYHLICMAIENEAFGDN